MSCIHRNTGHSTKRALYEKLRDKKVIGATRYLEKKPISMHEPLPEDKQLQGI